MELEDKEQLAKLREELGERILRNKEFLKYLYATGVGIS